MWPRRADAVTVNTADGGSSTSRGLWPVPAPAVSSHADDGVLGVWWADGIVLGVSEAARSIIVPSI